MRHTTITLLLTFILTNVYSQSLRTIKVKTPNPTRTKEVFQVKTEMPTIKNGTYKKYKNKKLIEIGFYKDNKKDSIWKIYSQGGQLIATGQYSSDTMIGIWTYFSKYNEIIQKYDHDKDSLIYFNVNGEKKIGNAPSVYPDTAQEQMPLFIGGTSYMYTLIENNMVYPKDAWMKIKSAKVYISFVVDTTGNTTEVKSLRHTGDGFDEEGIRLVESFGKAWIPGIQKGKKVKVQYNLPLSFKIK